MKLNNKGFTLVELLAVLAILITILLVAIPSITSSLSRSEKKELDAKKELIASSVEIAISKNDDFYSKFKRGECSFKVEKLIEIGYITEDMVKDNNGVQISGCVKYINNKYQFIDKNIDKECDKPCIS